MLRVEKHLPAPHRLAESLTSRAAKLILPFAQRSKSRLHAVLDSGAELAIFLPRGTVLRGGDVLVAQDGSLIAVCAANETVLYVTAEEPSALVRAAYHLGNRHTPVELGQGYLKLEYDPVLADMLGRLGVVALQANMPFEPEAGAYVSHLGGGHRHGHDATFAEDYALAQATFRHHHGDGEMHDHAVLHRHGDVLSPHVHE